MGQYYKVVNADKKTAIEHSFTFIGGMKLTEHSYVNNPLAIYLRQKVANEWKGDRILHIGDYAKADDGTSTENVIKAMLKEGALLEDKEYPGTIDYESMKQEQIGARYAKCDYKNYRYVANIDKKVYYDLNEVIPCSLWAEANLDIKVGRIGPMTFDPLLLLVACGNGQGGGDYHESYNDEKLVGSWAGDHIMATNDIVELDGYKKVVYNFTEEKFGKSLKVYLKKLIKQTRFYQTTKDNMLEDLPLGKAQDVDFILEMGTIYATQIAETLKQMGINVIIKED